ncbi:dihydroxyacetone kinase phosphoryl donor subunit DhaM [Flaviflagellibacter deserti]|uniref:phosphoenolpyruvate--glycerone phosphotransferase n=1 Tax=Flaviflagellibacter deserti TaxID=2267266 RepID=A0ABV9YW86_9HYPH
MTDVVGIVIVSHSPLVAEGAADMVRQMVGDRVPLAWCGGVGEGVLGTRLSDIRAAIDRAWSERGVVVMVDLGGAETNSEMAIEALPPERRRKVVVANAPVVEGAVLAATEAASGAALATVLATAEEAGARCRSVPSKTSAGRRQ